MQTERDMGREREREGGRERERYIREGAGWMRPRDAGLQEEEGRKGGRRGRGSRLD